MLLLFIRFTICLQIYNFTDKSNDIFAPYIVTLYFDPLDKIEINLKNGTGAFFSTWEDDLFLEVETFDEKGDSTNYGDFGSESGLAGVYFQTKNYTLKFNNEAEEEKKIAILLDDEYFPSSSPDKSDLTFPAITEALATKYDVYVLRDLHDNFIYYFESKKNIIPMIIFYCVLGVLCILSMLIKMRCIKH